MDEERDSENQISFDDICFRKTSFKMYLFMLNT